MGRADATPLMANYFLEKLVRSIGKRPLEQIEPFEALAPLKRLEAAGKHETRRNVAPSPAGYSASALPPRVARAIRQASLKHYVAILEPDELGAPLRAIDDYTGHPVTKYALLVAPHIFVRPGEFRHAERNEFNFEAGVWKIPEGKMKSRPRGAAVEPGRAALSGLVIIGRRQPVRGHDRLHRSHAGRDA